MPSNTSAAWRRLLRARRRGARSARAGFFALLLLPGAGLSCGRTEAPSPRIATLRINTGNPNGAFHAVGQSLARLYAEALPGTDTVVIPSPAVAHTLRHVDEGTADIGFAPAGTTYLAFTKGLSDGVRRTHIRGIAVLYSSAFHFLVQKSGAIHSLGDLRGARIGVVQMSHDPDARYLSLDWIAEAYHVPADSVTLARITLADVVDALSMGRVDCVVLSAGFPASVVIDAAARPGIRLLPVDGEHALVARASQPFFRPIIIPGLTYPGQQYFVPTIGVDNLLVAHESLADDVVYRLTKTLFEALPSLARERAVFRYIDPERASATIIPLHSGAARYYREHQLTK